MSPRTLLLAALVLGAAPAAASTAWAAQKNEQATACRNEAERFAATFAPERAGRGAGGAATNVPAPSTTGSERDMAQRGGVMTPSPLGSGTRQGVDTAPGARAGTSLSEEDRRQLRHRVDEARAAADRGDTDGCLRNLREARESARQAGFGGGGGAAAPSQGTAGASGGISGGGSLNTNTAGSRPPGATGAAGATPGTAGRSGTGSSGLSTGGAGGGATGGAGGASGGGGGR